MKSHNPVRKAAPLFPVEYSTESEIQSVFRSFVDYSKGRGVGALRTRIARVMESRG